MRKLLRIEFDAKRVYGLDILRAVAILSVLAAHGAKILPQRTWHLHDILLPDGVFLFFILSGFLIGGILIKILENNKATVRNLFNFWIRRWFRTIPNYFLILTVLVILRMLFFGGFHGTDVGQYFLFVQNFNSPHPVFFSEAWTLSVEEWFYLLIPIMLFMLIGLFRITPKRAILMTVAAVMVASVSFRFYRYTGHHITSIDDWDLYYRKQVVTRLDSLMFGVLGAYLAYYYKPLWIRHKTKLFAVGLGLMVMQQMISLYIFSGAHVRGVGLGLYQSVFSFNITALGTLLLLPLLSELETGSGRVYQALTYASITSYSIYLIHVSLIQPLVFDVTAFSSSRLLIPVRYAMYWSLTIVCSILLYKYFEKPVMDVREKVVRRRKVQPEKAPIPEPELS